MKDFTVKMALVDALPVLFFCGSLLLISQKFSSALFLIGAACTVLAGLCKVLWKLIIGLKGRDVKPLNKAFKPLMPAGFLLMIIALIVNRALIDIDGMLAAITTLPSAVFFLIGALLMLTMAAVSVRFDRSSAKHNWRAQIINLLAQGAILLGMVFLD